MYKKHKYEEIFNTKFNIGFFVPKNTSAFVVRVIKIVQRKKS